MYTFRIHKSDGTTLEDFSSALSCARASIESVLYDHGAIVTEEDNLITINAEGLTAQECKERIAGCFCDKTGSMYPEFRVVEPQQ
jgi:hypothetical protein